MTPSKPHLSSFKVIGFDTMGTLLDERAGIAAASVIALQKLPGTTSEQFFEEFESHLYDQMTSQPPPTSYATNLATSFSETVDSLSDGAHKTTPAESAAFADSLKAWPAFPDTVASLQYLARNAHLVALSNMDTSTLVSLTTTGALKDVPFSHLQGGDKSKAFKPDHRVNQALLDIAEKEYGVGKEEVLLVAQGLGSDHVPAREMGIKSVWIDRYGAGEEAAREAKPTWTFKELREMIEEMNREDTS
jgi:2-haloalkanoic acid dehalogenase type II